MNQTSIADARTFDPRSRYRHPKINPTGNAGKRLIQGGQPTCKFCNQPATEVALPYGHPVCSSHGDSRS